MTLKTCQCEIKKWTLKEWIAHTKIRLALGNAGPMRKARMAKQIEQAERRIQALEMEEVLTK